VRSLGRVASGTRSIARYSNIRRFAGPVLALSLALWPTAASAALPDGRAYELVSPAQKLSVDIHQTAEDPAFSPILSPDGNSIAFTALDGLPGGVSNGFFNAFRAIRGAQSWGIEQLNSPLSSVGGVNAATILAADPELETFVQSGPPSKPLTDDAADGVANLYLRTDEGFRLITVGAPGFRPDFFTDFVAHSADFGHVVFTTNLPLAEGDPEAESVLYDWDAATGLPTVVGVLPNDEVSPGRVTLARPPLGAEFPNLNEPVQHWNPVSADGSRIFFETEGQLFVRIGGTETKQVSAPVGAEDPAGPQVPRFRYAAEDGSRAFFTSAEKLTDDSTSDAASGGEDLYRFDVATGALTDITVAADVAGAQVQGVLGGAEDGSRLYFVARGDLAGDATAGENNLYLWEDDGSAKGEITHIATGVDPTNWLSSSFELPFRNRLSSHVTPDGESVLFESTSPLTGFPNEGHFAAYLFTIGEQLKCVSCNPEGTPATADALAVGAGDAVMRARVLTDDGGLAFFTTSERLLEGDQNDVADVYRFDTETEELALVSTGTSTFPSVFSDASADGSDIAFTTRESLVRIDTDRAMDVYDARIGGGLASQNPPPKPAPCQGQQCRAPVAPTPPATPPASSTLIDPAPNAKQPKKQKKKKKKGKGKQKQGSGKRNGQR
jgi:WD40-like Beta Propeller Repeat